MVFKEGADQDSKSRTLNSGFRYSHRSNNIDNRTFRWIYCLDPPRGLGVVFFLRESSWPSTSRGSGRSEAILTFRLRRPSAFWCCLDSQVAGDYRPLYPEVDHYWFKVARNYEPLALQVVLVLDQLFTRFWDPGSGFGDWAGRGFGGWDYGFGFIG